MKYNRNKIIKNSFNIAFKKGIKSYLLLVFVCFIFSFIGSSNGSQASFISYLDYIFKFNTSYVPDNAKIINEFILNGRLFNYIHINKNILSLLINTLVNNHAWFVNLLALNFAYFQRNVGEVVFSLLIVSIISIVIKIFIQNAFEIGKFRYFEENRFNRIVKIKRIFSPFHRKYILNIIIVELKYKLSLFLWLFTIVMFPVKVYEYSMIPFILAENPSIKFKDAKELSRKMTNGNKLNIFITQLSCIYIYLLKLIPGLGLCIALPFEGSLMTEIYFNLRNKYKNNKLLCEGSFNSLIYPNSIKQDYKLRDVIISNKELRENIKSDIKRNGSYNIYDYILFFFTFSCFGYIWEVTYHLVNFHQLVNKGTLYGPWLPIYGIGGVIIIFLLDKFKNKPKKVFLYSLLICAIVEYIASWILEFFYNSSYWDYKNMFLNINGRICLAGLIVFGLGGLFGIYIAAPRISCLTDKIGIKKTKIICIILLSLFSLDLVYALLFGLHVSNGVGSIY